MKIKISHKKTIDQLNKTGATRFVEGSHFVKRYPTIRDNKKAKSVECEPGDLIILNSSVWHGLDEKLQIEKE